MLAGQVAKFGLVGIVNTIIDFGVFNFLAGKRFRLGKLRANLVSTTIAMIFSFFANQRFVFGASGGNFWLQVITFYAVTAFGLYVLQNLVIYIFTKYLQPLHKLVFWFADLFRLRKRLSDDFLLRNTAKLAGTVVSLTWNFILFQKVVFKK